MNEFVDIASRDYWFKVVGMLQQNWALVDLTVNGAVVYFVNDGSGVFDELTFDSVQAAESELRLNGFSHIEETSPMLPSPPEPPFCRRPHPNGPIYSSGRFWTTNTTAQPND